MQKVLQIQKVDSQSARTRLLLSREYLRQRQTSPAISLLEQVEQSVSAIKNPQLMALLLDTKAVYYLNTKKKPSKEIDDLIVQGISFSERYEQYWVLGSLWQNRGNLWLTQDSIAKAIQYVKRAQLEREEHGVISDLAKGNMLLCTLYGVLDDNSQAMLYGKLAHKAFLQQREYESALTAILAVSNLMANIGNKKEEQKLIYEAILFLNKYSDIHNGLKGKTYATAAVYYLPINSDSVLYYGKLSIEYFNNVQDVVRIENSWQYIATAYLDKKMYVAALHAAEQSLSIISAYPQRFSPYQKSEAYSHAGNVYRVLAEKNTNYEKKAVLYLQQSALYAAQQSSITPILNAQYQLSKALALAGRQKEALHALDSAYILKTVLYENQSQEQTNNFSVLYEVKEKEARIIAEATRADSNRRALGWAIVALAVAVAAIGVFVWLNRQLHRQNEIIEQQRAKLAVSNREVHHNLSNQLQAIKSQIANQSSYNKHVEVQNVLREMATRVEAIQCLHTTLYQQADIQQVENVGEYLTEICDSVQYVFNKEKNIALTIDFATLSFSPKRAEDVAIFLNEALTNAYKYAFEGGIAAPKIAVSLRVAGNSLCLEIRDNGNGFPEKIDNITENPRSFGTYLLQSRATALGGTLLRYNDSGAVVRLTIPLAE